MQTHHSILGVEAAQNTVFGTTDGTLEVGRESGFNVICVRVILDDTHIARFRCEIYQIGVSILIRKDEYSWTISRKDKIVTNLWSKYFQCSNVSINGVLSIE
jgi:hypothetical protein